VLHKRAAKEPELVQISHGTVVTNGLTLMNGALLVTTTQGVQLFE
jgi:hypothetical protein